MVGMNEEEKDITAEERWSVEKFVDAYTYICIAYMTSTRNPWSAIIGLQLAAMIMAYNYMSSLLEHGEYKSAREFFTVQQKCWMSYVRNTEDLMKRMEKQTSDYSGESLKTHE